MTNLIKTLFSSSASTSNINTKIAEMNREAAELKAGIAKLTEEVNSMIERENNARPTIK